jgi:hypothetical protein
MITNDATRALSVRTGLLAIWPDRSGPIGIGPASGKPNAPAAGAQNRDEKRFAKTLECSRGRSCRTTQSPRQQAGAAGRRAGPRRGSGRESRWDPLRVPTVGGTDARTPKRVRLGAEREPCRGRGARPSWLCGDLRVVACRRDRRRRSGVAPVAGAKACRRCRRRRSVCSVRYKGLRRVLRRQAAWRPLCSSAAGRAALRTRTNDGRRYLLLGPANRLHICCLPCGGRRCRLVHLHRGRRVVKAPALARPAGRGLPTRYSSAGAVTAHR